MKIQIKNFRSIKEQEVELGPITVVYGPNGAGKSSLLYTLLTLRNVVLNPNQNSSGFFNYAFASLGSFEAVVFDHRTTSPIELSAELEKENLLLKYQVTIKENQGTFSLFVDDKGKNKVKFELPVTFPYSANQTAQQTVYQAEKPFVINWNGITAQPQPAGSDKAAQEEAQTLAAVLNSLVETLRKIAIVPLKRGFSKPHYSPVGISQTPMTEDEVATSLSNDKYLTSKVSFYLEQILGRDLRVNVQPGTALFSLDSTDRSTGVASELVNDGFGVNQIVYFLARCLHKDSQWVCIEEPEIHLHPTAVRKLAKVLVQIVRDEAKSFVISTHSETFLTTLLTLVSAGELRPNDIDCYFARKEKKLTRFERQTVNEKGQIEGGLASFMEAELEDLRTFLKPEQ